jgi:hypothetical protein
MAAFSAFFTSFLPSLTKDDDAIVSKWSSSQKKGD